MLRKFPNNPVEKNDRVPICICTCICIGNCAKCTVVREQVNNSEQLRSISRASGKRQHSSAETGVNQRLTLYSAKYWILNEGSALGPIYKAWPRRPGSGCHQAWTQSTTCYTCNALGMSSYFQFLTWHMNWCPPKDCKYSTRGHTQMVSGATRELKRLNNLTNISDISNT